MKPYVKANKDVGKTPEESRLPSRLRKLHSRKKKESRRLRRKADRKALEWEWKDVLQ